MFKELEGTGYHSVQTSDNYIKNEVSNLSRVLID